MVLWSLLYYNLNQTVTWMFLQLCMLIQVLNLVDGAWYEQSLLLRASCSRSQALWAPLHNYSLDLHGPSNFLYNALICS